MIRKVGDCVMRIQIVQQLQQSSWDSAILCFHFCHNASIYISWNLVTPKMVLNTRDDGHMLEIFKLTWPPPNPSVSPSLAGA